MQNRTRRIAGALIIGAGTLLAGCGGSGGSGTKPNSQVRAVDVATNVVNTLVNSDTGSVLINGGTSDEAVPYGVPSRYLYVESGYSQFQGATTMTLPTISTTVSGVTTTATVTLPINTVNLISGQNYTGYLVGRPDVPNPTQADLSDLDPRILKVIVLDDNQAGPVAGMATVRVLNGACDAGNVDVLINGAPVTAYSNIPYATQADPSTSDQSLSSGVVTVSVKSAGTGTVLVPPTTLTLASGGKYTVAVDEPTAITQAGVVAPTPPAAATTYGLTLVQN